MKKERFDMIIWIKDHKKQLVLTGISVGALILVVLCIKNRKELKVLFNLLLNTIGKSTKISEKIAHGTVNNLPAETLSKGISVLEMDVNNIPFEVARHIRNLPEGYHASAEKIADALKYNILLENGQTWVESYMKGLTAA